MLQKHQEETIKLFHEIFTVKGEGEKEIKQFILSREQELVRKVVEMIIDEPYNSKGYGCGIEDNGITDRYEACEYGAEQMRGDIISLLSQLPPSNQ